MKNPFVFGKIVGEENFCNRTTELDDLTRHIKNCYSVWLFAPRRYGKSSLIRKVFKDISSDVKTVYFDLYNIKSLDDFVRNYSNTLANELFNWKDDIRNITNKLGKYLKSLQPQLNFDADANPSISLMNKEIKEQPEIEEILNLPAKISKEQNVQICVAFDEFQEITRIDKFLINWMRSVFQNQQNVSYVFLGSKKSLMESIFSEVNSPFYEYALKMDIKEIPRADLFNFIGDKFLEQKLEISSDTINDILTYSKCHPHFSQYFASVVFDEIRNGADQKDKDFHSKWMNKIIDSQSVIFQNIYDQLNNNQRKILMALTSTSKEIYSNEIRKKFDLPTSSTLTTNIAGLVKRDIIYKTKSEYIISNPVFENWIKTL